LTRENQYTTRIETSGTLCSTIQRSMQEELIHPSHRSETLQLAKEKHVMVANVWHLYVIFPVTVSFTN